MAQPKTRLDWRFLLLFPVPLLWWVLSWTGHLERAEDWALAWRYRVRGELTAPVKIAYVNLDTRGLLAIGEKPWNRAQFAAAARALLTAGGARAVGFDFVFSDLALSALVPRENVQEGNLALGRVARDFPAVVLAANYSGGQGIFQPEEKPRIFPYLRYGFTDPAKNDLPEQPPFPIVGEAIDRRSGELRTWGTLGLIDVDYELGGGGSPRWVPLFAQTPVRTYHHLSVQLARLALGLPESAIRVERDVLRLVRDDGVPAATVPLRYGQMLEVNWFTRWASPAHDLQVSLADVLLNAAELDGDDEAKKAEAARWFEAFRDAIVLIGPTDPLLQDLAPTPFDRQPVPKVGLHGNLVKTILTGRCLQHLGSTSAAVLTLVLTLAVTLLAVAGGAHGLRAKLLAVALLGGYVVAALIAFARLDLVLPVVAPVGAAFTTSFGGLLWQVIREEKQKGRIKGMFGAYVSPQLVERLVESGEDPQLGGHEVEITAYFSDIQSFSTFAEKLPPAKLVELMNEYLTACTDIVQEEGGTLDKYIGDAVVAMFGAPIALPDHAYRACIASLRVHAKIGELRAKWQAEGDRWPEVVRTMQSRIGLNSGLATIGNMGSRTRFNYTMMGDNVNLAARMESGAKSWGVYSLCTDATKSACERHGGDRVVFRPLGRIVVMGRSQPVPIYEIVGLKEQVGAGTRECLGLFEQALARYHARDWTAAKRLFGQSAELEPNQPGRTPGVKSNPSLAYQRIVARYEAEPPGTEWDGVYVMQEK
ncbi:MAG TPA: adenylate/guanylate cyclase domain-containing protein [Opitutaceae bacterium]